MASETQETQIEAEALPKLTRRQEAFVQEYLVDLNATQAAIRAGYAPRSSNSGNYATDLLKNPAVSRHIEVAKAQRAARLSMSQATVLDETAILALASIDWFYIDDEGQVSLTEKAPANGMRAVASIDRKVRHYEPRSKNEMGYVEYETRLKLWDKPGSLKLMGRHLGLFPDRVEVTGKNGGPIELKALTDQELAKRAEDLAKEAALLASNT